jgi:hypothetical protein
VETIKTLEQPDGPLPRLQLILLQLETRFRSDNSFRSSLKWPFQEKDVRKIIDGVEREKSLLGLALQKDSRQLIRAVKSCAERNSKELVEVLQTMSINSCNTETNFNNLTYQIADVQAKATGLQDGIDHLRKNDVLRDVSALRKAILQWLTSYDHAAKHHGIIKNRQQGTGTWLLESDAYHNWLSNTDSQGQRVLCTGLPGVGKTMLTSIIIDDLQRRFTTDPSCGLAFFYCDYKFRGDQTVEHMSSSLLKQMISHCDPIPAIVRQLYDRCQGGTVNRQLKLEDLTRCLQSVTASFSRVCIVIGALDECQAVDGRRTRFLAELFGLQSVSKVSLLATSRHIPDITDKFGVNRSLEIRATSDDVRRYVEGNIDNLPTFVRRNPDLEEQVKTSIVESVDGM